MKNLLSKIVAISISILLLNVFASCQPCGETCQGSSSVVFLSDRDEPGKTELYLTSTDGDINDIIKISTGVQVDSFKPAPDGSGVAYTNFDGNDSLLIYYNLQNAINSIARIGPKTAQGVAISDYQWSPNGEWVALTLNQIGGSGQVIVCINIAQLQISQVQDSTNAIFEVSRDLADAAAAYGPSKFFWAPDSSKLAYVAAPVVNGTAMAIYTNIPNGSIVTETKVVDITDGAVLSNLQGTIALLWSPDSQHIAYKVLDNVNSNITLNRVAANNGSNVDTLYSNSTGTVLRQGAWSPDSSRIAYVENDLTQYNLRVSTRDGTDERILASNILVANLPTIGFSWSTDNGKLIFRSDEDSDTVYELVQYTLLSSTRSIIANPISGSFAYSSENNLAFISDGWLYGQHEQESPIRLSSEANVGDFVWAPNGEVVAATVTKDARVGLEINSVYGTDLIKLFDLGYLDGSIDSGVQWASNNAYLVFRGILPNKTSALVSFSPSKKDFFNLTGPVPEGRILSDFAVLPVN